MGRVGWRGACQRSLYFVHYSVLRCKDLWDRCYITCFYAADGVGSAMTVKSQKTRLKFFQVFKSSNQHGTVVKLQFLDTMCTPVSTVSPGTKLRASLRSWNALGHFTWAILCKNWQEKCRGPRSRPTLCASLRSRNALGHCTNENLQVKCCRPRSGTTLLCEPAQLKCTWTLHNLLMQ